MKLSRVMRGLLGFGLFLAVVLTFGLLLSVTDAALNLWQRLLQGPAVLRFGFIGLLLVLLAVFCVLTFRLLKPKRAARANPPQALDEQQLRDRLGEVAESGVNVAEVEAELSHLQEHRAVSNLSIALFGAVSTGKSSLAKALLPDAEVLISPVAGSTASVSRFQWEAPTGATVTIADLPGLQAVGQALDPLMIDEARRAHAVVFVTDGDLSRQQVAALNKLRALKKPLIVTLNKADRYTADELQSVLSKMQKRLNEEDQDADSLTPALIVTIAGGEEDVVVQTSTGDEHRETRSRAHDVSQLILALEELLGRDLSAVNALREQSLLTLAAEKLAEAETNYRAQRAQQIVQSSTRRAVIGALAAVTPGTDIVIQGYLGTNMTRELCKVYGQEARDLEIDRFLDLSQSRVGKVVPLSLAIAGNGLKAFPGVGTIAGGLVHAVAYGLLFDAVGRGLSASLAREEAFDAVVAADAVQKGLDEHLEQGVRRVAKIALDYRTKSDG